MRAFLQQQFGCPVEFALEFLGGKWTTVLLAHLRETPLRYSELSRRVPDLSDKMLTQRLKELQQRDLIERDAGSGAYRLTERGDSLGPILKQLFLWGSDMATELDADVRSLGPKGKHGGTT